MICTLIHNSLEITPSDEKNRERRARKEREKKDKRAEGKRLTFIPTFSGDK